MLEIQFSSADTDNVNISSYIKTKVQGVMVISPAVIHKHCATQELTRLCSSPHSFMQHSFTFLHQHSCMKLLPIADLYVQ